VDGSGIRCLFDPGMVKKSGSRYGMNNPVNISESLENNFLGENPEIL
jgi:hypothetical protein